MPAFVMLALRPSSPTSPGQSPAKFATVRIGPRCVRSPASTWCEYCQFAIATMRGASSGMFLKTSRPMRWLEMKPWPVCGSTSNPRTTLQPSASTAAVTPASTFFCVSQPAMFADSRRSPLVMR